MGERFNGPRRNSGSSGSFGDRRNSHSFGPREMHKAICSDCKKECEVPFKPTQGKPVYCRDCFRNRN